MSRGVAELIFKADGRSAIRTMKDIAAQGDSMNKSLKRGADESSASMERMHRSTSLLRSSIGGLAGMVGLGGLAFGLKDLPEPQGSQRKEKTVGRVQRHAAEDHRRQRPRWLSAT